MKELVWSETSGGLECDGYRIRRGGADHSRPWLLEPTRMALFGRYRDISYGSSHRSVDEAIRSAESAERNEFRRAVAAGHFVLAAAALSSFVVSSQAIGSLGGLLLVAATLYVALRSLGNGIGVLLNDAWGWTRLGRAHSSLLERFIPVAVSWIRRRRTALDATASPRSVRELSPPPPR